MKLITAVTMTSLLAFGSTAFGQESCKSISDSLERLRCYDGANGGALAPVAKPLAPADNPAFSKAKAAVIKLLRDPGTGRFERLRTSGPATCGEVNSRNAMGGMTGPQLFVYDGNRAHILINDTGPENGTSFDEITIGVLLSDGLKAYDRYCKGPH